MCLPIRGHEAYLCSCELTTSLCGLVLAASCALSLTVSPSLRHILPLLLVVVDSIDQLFGFHCLLYNQLLRPLEIDVAQLLNTVHR